MTSLPWVRVKLRINMTLLSCSTVLYNFYIPFVVLLVPVRELDVPGDIYERKTYPFEFPTVEMPYETYNGVNVRLRYYIILFFFS